MDTTLASKTIPAGGNDPSHFEVKEAWYPVAYLEDLDKTKPTTFTLLEIDLVIWWDNNSQSWRAFADRCPHRLASLSEGRINEGSVAKKRKVCVVQCNLSNHTHNFYLSMKGQVEGVSKKDVLGQKKFVESLFGIAV